MWNLKKNDTNELIIYKTETDSQTKQTYGYQGEGSGGGDRLGIWD